MKLGTENRNKVAVAAGLMLVAVFVLVRNFMPASEESTPAATATPQGVLPILGKKPGQMLTNDLDPRLHLDVLKASEGVEYKGNGRNIFRVGFEPPKLPDVKAPIIKSGPPPPPPPPRINLKYFGFATRQGSNQKVFLSEGDDVFVAAAGDIVNRRYKILRVTPTSVDVEDVISNVRQTLPLSQS